MKPALILAAAATATAAALLVSLPAAAAPASPTAPRGPAASPVPSASPATLAVGRLVLEACDVLDGAYCGSLERPLDPTGAVAGRVTIGFALLPSARGLAPRTMSAHEGGPGYATTASASGYAEMYGPLLETRNLLLIDQRGTGRSGAIACPSFLDDVDFAMAVLRCGQQLGASAHLYGTQLAADDEAAIIRALGLGKVDVYGDSYGTFYAQVFASRHPGLTRSLVVDAAYPTFGETAWYPTQGPAMRRSFDAVCARTPQCARLGGSTVRRLETLLDRIRREPISGTVYGADLARHRVTLDASALNYLAFNATYTSVTYRELDAAARAYLSRDDRRPLLRLLAEAYYPGGGASTVEEYSDGQYVAVSCQDYPTLYDMRAPFPQRQKQFERAIARQERRDPGVYAPFTIQEYLDSDWSEQGLCLTWPGAPDAYRQGPIEPPAGGFPSSVPVLVLSGELDSITTPAEGAIVADQWPSSQQIVVANSFHVTAIGDTDDCAQRIVRAFTESPWARIPRSVRACAGKVPPVRAAPAYRLRSAEAPPAVGTGTRAQRSAATTAAETVADLLDRWTQTYEDSGVGLRGGRWTSTWTDMVDFRLDRYRLVRDLAVSGTVRWDRAAGTVVVDLRLMATTPSGSPVAGAPTGGRLRGSWDTRAPGATATLRGTLGGDAVAVRLVAP
ncbi:MAG: alpha/beta fold hydrolase [Candidatus Nanopelagicales bacterium]